MLTSEGKLLCILQTMWV